MSGKHCPQCGDPLEGTESRDGTIWECNRHGVVDWVFEDQTRTEYGPRAREKPGNEPRWPQRPT